MKNEEKIVPLTEIINEETLRVREVFQRYLKDHNIRLPDQKMEKRKVFINWYMDYFKETDFQTNINDLSEYYLFLTPKRIENIIMYGTKSKTKE